VASASVVTTNKVYKRNKVNATMNGRSVNIDLIIKIVVSIKVKQLLQ